MQVLHGVPALEAIRVGMAVCLGACAASDACRRDLWASWAAACDRLRRLLELSCWGLVAAAVVHVYRVMSSDISRREWRDFLTRWHCAEAVDCPICVESSKASAWNFVSLPCCGGTMCWSCLRQHAEAVIDDARPEMLCPLGHCRHILPDTLVLCAIRREQWSLRSLRSLDILGGLARRKRRTYERWVLSSGLAATCSARVEDVIHCPRPECGHMWVLPQEARRRKSVEEPRSRWNPKSWSLGRHMGLYTPLTEEGHDLRNTHCPKCSLDYCLLCSRPWKIGPKEAHEGKSCLEYGSSFLDRHGSEDLWAGAKACPGCGVHIIRSMGCNHMTCTQCSFHWCWACRSKWSPRHYSCVARRAVGQDACCIM